MTDELAMEIITSETSRELFKEIRTQYERRKWIMVEEQVTNTQNVMVTIHLPYDLLREAFDGIPPEKT